MHLGSSSFPWFITHVTNYPHPTLIALQYRNERNDLPPLLSIIDLVSVAFLQNVTFRPSLLPRTPHTIWHFLKRSFTRVYWAVVLITIRCRLISVTDISCTLCLTQSGIHRVQPRRNSFVWVSLTIWDKRVNYIYSSDISTRYKITFLDHTLISAKFSTFCLHASQEYLPTCLGEAVRSVQHLCRLFLTGTEFVVSKFPYKIR